jgi:NAD(P)-dependent dehydrogenase (short-subunit alcohol dehydrogenase family)
LRNPEDLATLRSQYPSEQLLVVPLDVLNESQISEAFATTKESFGRLDVCVNNAGYGLFGEIEGLPEVEARKQIEVLFWGPVKISKEVGN